MKLYEEIDRILLESPQSLGFSDRVADAISEMVPDSRKAQDALAILFKNSGGYGLLRRQAEELDDGFEKIMGDHADEFFQAFGKRLGIRRAGPDFRLSREDDDFVAGPRRLMTIGKKAKKALKKMSSDQSRKADMIDNVVDMVILRNLGGFANNNAAIVKFLNNDPNNYRKLKGKELGDAVWFSKQELKKTDFDRDRVFIEFPDGYFWYEILPEECGQEGTEMSHCGSEPRFGSEKTYSLRDPNNMPHVTIRYSPNVMSQLKGKGNDIPDDKYIPYIKEFLKKTEATVSEDWNRHGGDPEVMEFLDKITSEHGSHDFPDSDYDMVMDRLEYWLRDQLEEWKSEMGSRVGDYLRSFRTEIIDRNKDSGELGVKVSFEGRLPIHLFKGEENSERFYEILEPKWEWLLDYPEKWLFAGNYGSFDVEWEDGPYAYEEWVEVGLFSQKLEKWVDPESPEAREEFTEKMAEFLDSIKKAWTEENFLAGADMIYNEFVEPEL